MNGEEKWVPVAPICFTHDHCMDGFTSQWVLNKFYGDNADYEPWSYNHPISLDMVRMRNVIMADFSCKKDEMKEIIKVANSVLVLDHHHTAKEELDGLHDGKRAFIEFDMDRSGAGMTWDHFYTRSERPWLVSYVEDRDLWKWNLKGSREINALVQATPFTLDNWDTMDKMALDEAFSMGAALRMYIDQYCENAAGNVRFVDWEGVIGVPVVNAPYMAISDILNRILREYPPLAVGYFQNRDGGWQYSLRSTGEFDCSAIAKEYGGGGHVNAAGFVDDDLLF